MYIYISSSSCVVLSSIPIVLCSWSVFWPIPSVHTKQLLYGHLLPISQTIQIIWTKHAGHYWGSRNKLTVIHIIVIKGLVWSSVMKDLVWPLVKKDLVWPLVKKDLVWGLVKKDLIWAFVIKDLVWGLVKKDLVWALVIKDLVWALIKKDLVWPLVIIYT